MHVVISDVQHAAFYYLCQQISPKVLRFVSFAFIPSIVHIPKTQLVAMYHQLYFLPPLSCFHAHLLALSHIHSKSPGRLLPVLSCVYSALYSQNACVCGCLCLCVCVGAGTYIVLQ